MKRVVTDLVGRPFWQAHDRLFHLVAKAFATWNNPRHELTGLLRELGLPAHELLRAPGSTRTPVDAVSAPNTGIVGCRRWNGAYSPGL